MKERSGPGPLLLATDLSHRSDRALDRAIQIAREWQAGLVVAHAFNERADIYESPFLSDARVHRPRLDPKTVVRDRIVKDLLMEKPGVDLTIHVESGPPASVILEAAAQTDAALIVTGVARDETFGRWLLGDTVQRLMRKSPLPILVVRDRTHAPYTHMVVATDFSPSSRLALETAVQFFPEAGLSLFHGYDVPFANYVGRSQIERDLDHCSIEAGDKFLVEAGFPPEAARRVSRIVEHGMPEALLRDYAQRSHRHLTVVGTHGGGLLYEVVIGSTARKIVDAIPGDVLIVPDPGKRTTG